MSTESNALIVQGSSQPSSAAGGTSVPPPKYLLSLDGGGVRGLSALRILQSIMLQVNIQRKAKTPQGYALELKPCDIFDLIGGTSTGGLIAIMLGRLQMDVDRCHDVYSEFIPLVFDKKSILPINRRGKIKPRYDTDKLKEFIASTVKNRDDALDPTEVPLHVRREDPDPEPDCKVFVCTVSSKNSEISLLRSYRDEFYEKSVTPTIVEAALATTAATSYFGRAKIATKNSSREFVDGAIRANNPINQVVEEARQIWLKNPHSRVPTDSFVRCLISIGTGVPLQKEVGETVPKLFKTLKAIATETENTARCFENAWTGRETTYYRFTVNRGMESMAIDGDGENPEDAIDAVTEYYVRTREVKTKIYDCAQVLADKPLNPWGIVGLIEAGQEALANENFDEAVEKFCDADDLLFERSPDKFDKLDEARFRAIKSGMAEAALREAHSLWAQKARDREEIARMLVRARNRLEYANSSEIVWSFSELPRVKRDLLQNFEAEVMGATWDGLGDVIRNLGGQNSITEHI